MAASAKRFVFGLSILVGLPASSVACAEEATIERSSRDELAGEPTTVTPPSTRPDDTSDGDERTQEKDATGANAVDASSCRGLASEAECSECCAAKTRRSGLKGCGCSAASGCKAVCSKNLCAGALPDVACGLCLAGAGCDLALSEDDEDDGSERACRRDCEDVAERRGR
ncbi:MAG TPA: hypothetical protein VM925_11730 [Labilithrix sp.]|nr:hypothetical protein [Labilithrix sp.]